MSCPLTVLLGMPHAHAGQKDLPVARVLESNTRVLQSFVILLFYGFASLIAC